MEEISRGDFALLPRWWKDASGWLLLFSKGEKINYLQKNQWMQNKGYLPEIERIVLHGLYSSSGSSSHLLQSGKELSAHSCNGQPAQK
jgi:hypothetical protein